MQLPNPKDIKHRFELTAGKMPEEHLHTPILYTVKNEWELDFGKRYEINYSTEPGSETRAFLIVPKENRKKYPAALCAHPTNGELGGAGPAGMGGLPGWQYGFELAQRGYVTLSPDIVYFGKSAADPYALGYQSGTMKTIFDHMRAIDLLCSLEEVDETRIGAIGHSLGGHNAVFAALYDERVKVAVTSSGVCAFSEYVKTNSRGMGGWAQDVYMPLIREKFDLDPAKMPWDFPELTAALAPRGLFINAPLRDDNMNYPGNRAIIEHCEKVYAEMGASEQFTYTHPDEEHSFTDEIREKAYAFMDKFLQN